MANQAGGHERAMDNTSRGLFAKSWAPTPPLRIFCTISLQAISFSHLLLNRVSSLAGGRNNRVSAKPQPGAPADNLYIPSSHLMDFHSLAVRGLNGGHEQGTSK